VGLLLERGATIESKDKNDCTPLLFATRGRHDGVVRLLLDQGADLSATDRCGCRAIHYALSNKHEEMLRTLFERGESPNGTMPDGTRYEDALKNSPEIAALIRAYRNQSLIEDVIRQVEPLAVPPPDRHSNSLAP
jgi:ankyrin repeat protein